MLIKSIQEMNFVELNKSISNMNIIQTNTNNYICSLLDKSKNAEPQIKKLQMFYNQLLVII